jgi:hypothetical protein
MAGFFVGEDARREGLGRGSILGVHDVPGGEARGGPADLNEVMDAEKSLGAAVSLRLAASARGQGGIAEVRSEMRPVLACLISRDREMAFLLRSLMKLSPPPPRGCSHCILTEDVPEARERPYKYICRERGVVTATLCSTITQHI